MIVVTGAAGFIGSCILSKLNERGIKDVIAVDHLNGSHAPASNGSGELKPKEVYSLKKENLKDKKISAYYEKNEFIDLIDKGKVDSRIKCIIHMGACSSTTLQDAQYFKTNNLEYTIKLAQWAIKNNIRFIYASSAATYGDGSIGYCDDEETIRKCKPLNLYGQSKQDFDQWVLDHNYLGRVVGLKFFNVFGPNEYHKDDMRSVVAKTYRNVADTGKISLFKSYKKEYNDGEQKRDFIYVKDAVNVVMFFFDNPKVNGIFNVGTGNACTWNQLAKAIFKAVGKKPDISYYDMPESLKARYQYFTQADMGKLKRAGYNQSFTDLDEAVYDYVQYLKHQSHL